MSVDAQRFMDLMSFLHMIWSAPLQIVLALVFLYFTMGYSIFAGFVVMVLLVPINAVIAAKSRQLQVSVHRPSLLHSERRDGSASFLLF